MSYADKTLICRDCGQSFTFTVGEQEFYESRGFSNEPGRCPDCRAARKMERSGYGGGYGRQRESYTVTCHSCGNQARVPFQPRGDRPVYCSDCFERQRNSTSSHKRYR